MAVSRRTLTKHLEPARPLRRSAQIDPELIVNAAFAKALREDVDQMNCQVSRITSNIGDCTVAEVTMTLGIKQFHKTVNTSRQKQGRLTYTRDFIIGLASCPAAREMPPFLPDHPVVLTRARDPGHLWLHELLNPGEE